MLYANAGMMPKAHIDFKAALRHVLRCEVAYMFETGGEIIVQERTVTADGIVEAFAANVLGHYILVRRARVPPSQSLPALTCLV